MKGFFRQIFTKGDRPKSDFSSFFRDSSLDEKKRLLEDVVRKAQNDQQDIVDKYKRIHPGVT